MKDAWERKLQNQFGAFCVKVLKNEAKYIQRDATFRSNRTVHFDCLSESGMAIAVTEDQYFSSDHVFEVLGMPIVVTGDTLAKAIAALPEYKRDVILLSYFLEMSDREIGERLNAVRQTVAKRRLVTLKELHEYLIKEGFDWPDG